MHRERKVLKTSMAFFVVEYIVVQNFLFIDKNLKLGLRILIRLGITIWLLHENALILMRHMFFILCLFPLKFHINHWDFFESILISRFQEIKQIEQNVTFSRFIFALVDLTLEYGIV